MPQLLEGDVVSEFIPDRTALNEALDAARVSGRHGPLIVPGRFSLCDSVNGNNRRYPFRVWEKNLKEGSPLVEAVKNKRSLGLLEHPKDGNVSLLSPISHLVTAVKMEGKEVSGAITLVTTSEGNKMRALIEAGYNPFVSSRGYGSVIKGPDGIDEVQDDFVCETWDLVLNPSFKTAELTPQRESLQPVTEATLKVSAQAETPENLFAKINSLVNEGRIKADSVKLINGQVVLESNPVVPAAATPAVEPISTPAAPVTPAINTRDTMDIKTIRESVQALRQIDVSKIDPRQLAEGLTKMTTLHQEAAAIQDPKMSWDVQSAHKELDALEQVWSESAKAPIATLTKLQEQQTRTFKVLREACAAGIKYRNRLAETLKSLTKKEGVLAEVSKRGNVWRERAKIAESKLKLTESRLNLSYASLDEFVRRYHEDTTKLARGMLMLEHKAKIEASPELLKRVNEATRVEHLTPIKEEITGKKQEAAAVKLDAPATVVAAAPVAPATATQVESSVRPFTVSQLMECNTRLSNATALLG